MIKKTLADKTRALILKCGDRDDFRIFNANLVKYKYLSFYPYFENDENGDIRWDTPSLLIGFSNSDSEKEMDNATAYAINEGSDDDMFFVDSGLAYMLDNKRAVIRTDEIKPIKIEPISWDTVLKAEEVGAAEWGDLCEPLAEYMRESSPPYEFDRLIIEYLKKQSEIRLKLIFNSGSIRKRRKTTLVYFNDEFVGAMKHKGYDGCNCNVYAFDESKWFQMMEFIKVESGVDKIFEKSIVHIMDITKDADEYLFVPGVTSEENK